MSSNEKDVYKQFIPIDKETIKHKTTGDVYKRTFLNDELNNKYNFIFTEYSPHYVKVEWNLEQLNDEGQLEKEYPFLHRMVKRRLRFLTQLIEYSREKRFSRLARKEGNYYFFASSRYLAKYFSSYNTWNRNISIFCTLGLVNKVKIDKNRMAERRITRETKALAKRMNIDDHEKLSPINYYTIPIYNSELLTEANRRAKVLLDNNFRANGFSKFFLIKVFGQEFADTIFHDERYISEYSQYVQTQIEKFILNDIKRHGYTTKDRILRYVQINYSQLQPWEYGFKKEIQNKKAILSREFDRSISEIKDKYNLEYKKANKELKEKFKLDSSKTIIYEI
ncbi:hypothetical protein P4T54_00580 [Bacillus mycoides]|uniref:hypothetical protein n=1 Tax=Bacillus cereus group TaxID=86661 RepID=UPI00027BF2BE|nr:MULTISPECIES: hypothetical protein [Bacillus cereus group]OTX31602.1 hypothetical protein BK717_23735 [Bacillus thuringiensis serovar malayensis]OUB11311.1 hypothetical protein BK709_00295 [Bacillus thuringiensis serovar shandongiensis]EJV68224.1 hypothetical protein IEM_01832 [Bacillus cereus BAG6O-2]MEC2390160.1 hypothetical protein [Bacillus toyonensis]MED1043011.1 hypothetical protein [Bacillus mycoides]